MVTSVEGREWFMRYPVEGSFRGFPVGISFRSGTNSTPTLNIFYSLERNRSIEETSNYLPHC